MGFEKLVDVLLQFIDLFRFWQVVEPFEQAAITRLGIYKRTLDPGIHWLAPFGIENAYVDNVCVRTNAIAALNVTNIEGQAIRCDAIVKWQIRDLRKFTMEVEGTDDVIKDVAYSTISRAIRRTPWAEMLGPQIDETLTRECRRRGFRYGVEIESVELGDLVQTLPVSLMD